MSHSQLLVLFFWLYRAFPFLAAKNIINLILVLTIWWCPCVESSLVLLEEGVCYDQCILLAKLYWPLPCFIPYSKAKFACYPRCFLTSYFCIPVPHNEKDIFFWVLVLKGLVGLHRTVQLQLLQRYRLGQRLGLLWYWMFALETNRDHSVLYWAHLCMKCSLGISDFLEEISSLSHSVVLLVLFLLTV